VAAAHAALPPRDVAGRPGRRARVHLPPHRHHEQVLRGAWRSVLAAGGRARTARAHTRRARAQECGYDADDLSGGGGSNTHHLRAHYGWTGLLLDRGHANASINLHRELISSRNVLDLFRKHGVPLEPDYVSIDVDSTDLWVLRALLGSPLRPRVVSVEYNCVYGTDPVAATYPDDPDMPWEGDNIQCASLAAVDMVAREHGWTVATIVPRAPAPAVLRPVPGGGLAGVARALACAEAVMLHALLPTPPTSP